ncbi:Protein of unknown function [Pyronema omphalodes CBS 100304]|uniref:Uncharacterized protein n=1 Tax=Pyronema omphalodes (strain CBS 100304) TaxID=1076935 RepID=U4L4K0_PYROM|nr:Protein of unknown function [Pyronema omphalodes CBS 100304]
MHKLKSGVAPDSHLSNDPTLAGSIDPEVKSRGSPQLLA